MGDDEDDDLREQEHYASVHRHLVDDERDGEPDPRRPGQPPAARFWPAGERKGP